MARATSHDADGTFVEPARRPGSFAGRACIVLGPDDFDRVMPGDIIVAPASNPGWVPLFSIAGGFVTDTGGVLSHAAVVAREFGVPAVVGTGDATKRIADGRIVEIDGHDRARPARCDRTRRSATARLLTADDARGRERRDPRPAELDDARGRAAERDDHVRRGAGRRRVARHALSGRGRGRAAGEWQHRRSVRAPPGVPRRGDRRSPWPRSIAALAPSFGVLVVVAGPPGGKRRARVDELGGARSERRRRPDRRGAAFGLFDMLVSTSAALGPLVGGLIVGAFDWRAMFLLAAPIAVVAIVAVAIRPDPMVARRGTRRGHGAATDRSTWPRGPRAACSSPSCSPCAAGGTA